MSDTQKIALFWAAILGIVAGNIFGLQKIAERDERRDAYLVQHKCVVAGYAGNGARPYYQCENGLTRREDIK